MINPFEIMQTINMIDRENLDIRTITMGISLKNCVDPDIDKMCDKVYNKITTYAKDLVKTAQHLDDDEFLTVERIPFEKAVEMVMDNKIPDAKTQIAILKVYALKTMGKL